MGTLTKGPTDQAPGGQADVPLSVALALADIEAARELLANAECALQQAAKECNASREQIVEMYWSVPEVPVSTLAAKLGLTKYEATSQRVWGRIAVGYCRECGDHVYAYSRTGATRDWKFDICESCKPKPIIVNVEQLHEQRRQRELHLRRMSYAEYLQTDHWQSIRAAALRRARWRCQLCNRATSLDVHHRTYERRGCELLSDVIALCRPCHATHHGISS